MCKDIRNKEADDVKVDDPLHFACCSPPGKPCIFEPGSTGTEWNEYWDERHSRELAQESLSEKLEGSDE